jgi:hypothetical protein
MTTATMVLSGPGASQARNKERFDFVFYFLGAEIVLF